MKALIPIIGVGIIIGGAIYSDKTETSTPAIIGIVIGTGLIIYSELKIKTK